MPTFNGPHAILHPTHPSLSSSDFAHTATDPPASWITATIMYSDHPKSQCAQFPWPIKITPKTGTMVVTVYDVLACLCSTLQKGVHEQEMTGIPTAQFEAAAIQRANRLSSGAAARSTSFVRSDFLQGCVYFAGMEMAQNGSLVIKLLSRLN